MKKYTIEDVEYIRAKTDCTYDEVISLLDAYEGDVARVLADLERRGKLKKDASTGRDNGKSFGEAIKNIVKSGYEHRILVLKGDRTIVNISVLLSVVLFIIAPWLVVILAGLALIFGYTFRIKNEKGISDEFSSMAATAKENVKNAGDAIRNSAKDIKENVSSHKQDVDAVKNEPETTTAPVTSTQQNDDIIIE